MGWLALIVGILIIWIIPNVVKFKKIKKESKKQTSKNWRDAFIIILENEMQEYQGVRKALMAVLFYPILFISFMYWLRGEDNY